MDLVAGVTKVSTVDYPGELATVIYMPGCNMHCPYCHNREVALNQTAGIPWENVKWWLDSKSNITAVVISGGEPMLQSNCHLTQQIVQWVHGRGLKLKLDTNATMQVSQVVVWRDWLSYLAVDFKGLLEDYTSFGYSGPISLDFCWMRQNFLGRCELRTTVHKKLLSEDKLMKMATYIPTGVPWYLQKFRPCACFDMALNDAENYTDEELGRMAVKLNAVTRGCGFWDVQTKMATDLQRDLANMAEAEKKEVQK